MDNMGNKPTSERKDGKPFSVATTNTDNSDREEFRFIYGRRYHNVENSKYSLPNDDEECDRQHMQHFVFRSAWQGNFGSPVDHILKGQYANVLDSGCGVGSWSFDMATDYPNTKFTGIDISPIQPSQVKPDNFTYIQANILDGLPFEDNTFDYVFQRLMVSVVTRDKWLFVINELTRVLKPGGYLELLEVNPLSENLGPSSAKLANAMVILCERSNLDTELVTNLKSYLERQPQLKKIVREEKLIYGGREAGKLGQAFNDDAIQFYNSVKPMLSSIMQVTSEEYDQIVETTREEWLERNSFQRFVRIYARKG